MGKCPNIEKRTMPCIVMIKDCFIFLTCGLENVLAMHYCLHYNFDLSISLWFGNTHTLNLDVLATNLCNMLHLCFPFLSRLDALLTQSLAVVATQYMFKKSFVFRFLPNVCGIMLISLVHALSNSADYT